MMSAAVTLRRCRHGTFMFMPHDQYVGRCLELFGEYGEDEVALFRQLVKPGDVVVEAGANIGSLTIPLARLVGDQGRIIALEPQRHVYHVLCGNLALNGLLQVDAVRAACGDQPGRISVPRLPADAKINFGGQAVGEDGQASLGAQESVPMVTIDSMHLARLNFVKIDVEGSELAVVQGAARSIAAYRPILYVENDRQEKSAALIAAIQALGYALWWHVAPLYNPNNFHSNPNNTLGNFVSVNMLAVPAEQNPQIRGLRPVTGPQDWWKI